jgi:hypothetical protein
MIMYVKPGLEAWCPFRENELFASRLGLAKGGDVFLLLLGDAEKN